jgi:hypothetical protein
MLTDTYLGAVFCVIVATCTLHGVGVVVGSLRHRPNQPRVSQVVVLVEVDVVVLDEVEVVIVAVISSKQPH